MPKSPGYNRSLEPPRGVAQLAEHRSPKPGVAGSSPAAPVPLSQGDPPNVQNVNRYGCYGLREQASARASAYQPLPVSA